MYCTYVTILAKILILIACRNVLIRKFHRENDSNNFAVFCCRFFCISRNENQIRFQEILPACMIKCWCCAGPWPPSGWRPSSPSSTGTENFTLFPNRESRLIRFIAWPSWYYSRYNWGRHCTMYMRRDDNPDGDGYAYSDLYY